MRLIVRYNYANITVNTQRKIDSLRLYINFTNNSVLIKDWIINACQWQAEDMRDWIKGNLGPSLEAAGLRRLKLMVHDFNRDKLPDYVVPVRFGFEDQN